MTREERLNSVAEAWHERGRYRQSSWDEITEAERRSAREAVAFVLDAVYPELADGKHWIAPMEPTDAMCEAWRDYSPPAVNTAKTDWRAMRDAFLAQSEDRPNG